MTPKKFNKLSLDKKIEFIKESLNEQQMYGVVNQLIFDDWKIFFMAGMLNGKIWKAEAEHLPEEIASQTKKIIDIRNGCVNIIQDNQPVIKNRLYSALKRTEGGFN